MNDLYQQQFGPVCREEKKKHIVHSISCVAVYKLYFLTPSNVGLVKTQDAGCNLNKLYIISYHFRCRFNLFWYFHHGTLFFNY